MDFMCKKCRRPKKPELIGKVVANGKICTHCVEQIKKAKGNREKVDAKESV